MLTFCSLSLFHFIILCISSANLYKACKIHVCTCNEKFLCVYFQVYFQAHFTKLIVFHILISAALKLLDMQSLVFHCHCLSVFLRQSLIFSGQVLSSSLMMIVFSLLFYQVAGSCMPYPKIQVCRSIRFSPVRCVRSLKQVL